MDGNADREMTWDDWDWRSRVAFGEGDYRAAAKLARRAIAALRAPAPGLEQWVADRREQSESRLAYSEAALRLFSDWTEVEA